MSALTKLVDLTTPAERALEEAFEKHGHVGEFLQNEYEHWSVKSQELLLRVLLERMPIVLPDTNGCVVNAYKPVLSRMEMTAEPNNNGKHLCEITSCSTNLDKANDGQLVIFAKEEDLTTCAADTEE